MSDWSPEALATPDTTSLEEIFDLEDEGDKEVLRELYEQLLEDGPARMAQLFESMTAGDLDTVDRIAHRLKSSFGNLGFVSASDLCNEIMVAAREGRSEPAHELCGRLNDAAESLVQGITGFLHRL